MFNKIYAFYVLGTIVDNGDIAVNKLDKKFFTRGATFLVHELPLKNRNK